MSFELKAPIIICLTRSGFTARMLSMFKPKAHIIAVTNSDRAVKSLLLKKGVHTIKVDNFNDIPEVTKIASIEAIR